MKRESPSGWNGFVVNTMNQYWYIRKTFLPDLFYIVSHLYIYFAYFESSLIADTEFYFFMNGWMLFSCVDQCEQRTSSGRTRTKLMSFTISNYWLFRFCVLGRRYFLFQVLMSSAIPRVDMSIELDFLNTAVLVAQPVSVLIFHARRERNRRCKPGNVCGFRSSSLALVSVFLPSCVSWPSCLLCTITMYSGLSGKAIA